MDGKDIKIIGSLSIKSNYSGGKKFSYYKNCIVVACEGIVVGENTRARYSIEKILRRRDEDPPN